MLDIFKKLNALLSSRERTRAKLVFVLMLVMAFMETLGVASIMPFVAVLANPQIVETNYYISKIYNTLGFSSVDSFLFLLGILVFVLFVSSLLFKALTTYAITRFSNMRLHSMACRLLSAYLRQPYEFFLGRNTSDMGKSILSEVSQVINGVILPSMKVISGSIVAISLLGLLLIVEPLLSLGVAILLGGSYAFIYIFSRKLLKRIGEDRLLANKQRFIFLSEVLNGIKELKLLGREGAYMERFKDPSERHARHQATKNVIIALPRYAIQAVAFGGILLIVLYLIGQHESLDSALPYIALYAMAGNRLLPAFQEIFGNFSHIRFSLPVLESLYADLTLKEKRGEPSKIKTSVPLYMKDNIRLDNVSYCYPDSGSFAIKSLSLTIPAGSSVGFAGSTGAGKSTTVDLILGLLSPSTGQILVDGQPLNSRNLRAWQDNIGYVPQSIYLADDTVAGNIAFGVSTDQIDHEALERAARTAHIHDFIVNELPHGYDTHAGERGIRLSGGQRQRLAIARALYHNPDVVVFDEATSALDNTTEAAVMEAIEDLHGSKTVILIAHRLTTVQNCDFIFYLDKGNLLASGSFGDLLKNNEQFRQMVQLGTDKRTASIA